MKQGVSFVLSSALFAGMVFSAATTACAQESGGKAANQSTPAKSVPEKGTKEQSASDKGKEEMPLSESSANFPQVGGPVELRAPRGTRITLKLADSSVIVYQAIASQARISVLFDPDYVPRNVSVDLKGVPLEDALKIVAFQSRTFWRPVTSDSIFVAQDSTPKRHEFGQQIVKSYYFPNIASPTDMQDVVNAMRTIVEVQRVQQMPGYQTITVRASPDQMAIVDKIVDDLKHAKEKIGGEYRLEFKIIDSEDRKSAPRTYSLLIEPHETGKLRIGPRIPIVTKDQERTYTDAGKNIDCQIRSETEHTVSLKIAVEFSEVAMDEHGVVQTAPGNPVIQRVSMETSVTLDLGTPTVIGNLQDPVSKRIFQVEATATKTKNKE